MAREGTQFKWRVCDNPEFVPFAENNKEVSDVAHALAGCEIDLSAGATQCEKKCVEELLLIESFLEKQYRRATKELLFLAKIISLQDVDAEESLETQNRRELLLTSISKIREVIRVVVIQFRGLKKRSLSLSPILRMGGYRSVCVCLIESFQSISTSITSLKSRPLGLGGQKNRNSSKNGSTMNQASDDLDMSPAISHKGGISMTRSLYIPIKKHRRTRSINTIFSKAKKERKKTKKAETDPMHEEEEEEEDPVPIAIEVDPKPVPMAVEVEKTVKAATKQVKEQVQAEKRREPGLSPTSAGTSHHSLVQSGKEVESIVSDFYEKKKQTTIDHFTQEIATLQLTIDRLNKEMEKQVKKIAKEEEAATERMEKMGDDVVSENELPIKFCSSTFSVLSDLKDKLCVCMSIPEGEVFQPLVTLYEKNPDINPHPILVISHLGYEIDKNLLEYSKKMKVIYCAVYDSFSVQSRLGTNMMRRMKFGASAAYYMLSPHKSSDKYGGLREYKFDVDFVCEVWDLLEDPVTSFFAKSLGFAPSIEDMATNCELRIPVATHTIFKKEKNNESVYRIRGMFISPFGHTVSPKMMMRSGRKNFREEDFKPIKTRAIPGYSFAHHLLKSVRVRSGESHDSNIIILHIHGGGWVSQSPDQHLPYLSEWANVSNLPAISIDYSLSPDVQYPIPVNECYAVYKWLQEPKNCAEIGIETKGVPPSIIVCGDSAGGNLSCAISVKAIQEGIVPPAGLLLHYPAMNLALSGSLSRLIFSHDPILNLETTRCVVDCYLGESKADNKSWNPAAMEDPLISPLFASYEIFEKFPRTVVCVGDVDPLLDDGIALFDRLQKHNIPSLFRLCGGLPHGYLNLPTQLPKARHAISDAAVYMKWLKDEHLKDLKEINS